ncbi:MAG: ABC transporter permease [Alphaproteobacteria bacterium]|nr:ABC transporter permease [Alphaproteobacteria bacterium]
MVRVGRRQLRLAIPMMVVLTVIVVALLAPLIAPFDPTTQNLALRLRPPRWMPGGDPRFLLGTDHLGRDILSRLLYGTRVSLPIAFAATTIGGIVGISLGLLSGYFRGAVDSIVTKLIDIQLSFPFILFAIAVMAVTGPNPAVLVLVLAARSWTTFARVVRGETLTISGNEYVLAARALGATQARVIGRHITPNILPLAAVIGTLDVGALVILESTLSFLGLGIQPPTVSWGKELSDARQYIQLAWWTTTFPGLALLVIVLSVNLLGDRLRDILDPRLRGR